MKIYTPYLKHHILTQYQPYSHTHNFRCLAVQYNIKGGESTIRNWYQQWDGTEASLNRKRVSGRPRILSSTQVQRHVATRI